MTTKELINQYVTAHADNRWMDASELEALLTEFAEKLKELTSEDLEQAAIDYDSRRPALYGEDDEGDYVEYIEVRKDAFIAGAEWQREQMMKGAIDTRIDKRLADMIGYTGSERVKVIIIKE
jgi:hypothetical protein